MAVDGDVVTTPRCSQAEAMWPLLIGRAALRKRFDGFVES
jgi:hypothetical protein